MRSRVRLGLIVSSAVFLLLGVGAFVLLAQRSADQISNITNTVDPNTGEVINSTSNAVQNTVILSTVLPASGIVLILLGVLCAAGAIASFVATEAVDRAAAHRAPAAPSSFAPEHLSPPETLQHG